MEKLVLSKVSLSDLKRLIHLQETNTLSQSWNQIDSILLTDHEQQQLQEIKSRLVNYHTHLMNEATIWARGIYPLLLLAEQGVIQAWAQVPLQALYTHFEAEGIADGVLGKSVSGRLDCPYLVVVETKKGIEGQNPIFQLYGQLLAAAHLNWEDNGKDPQEIFGCYTIADIWTFVRAEIEGLNSDQPTMRVETTREYAEQYDAETILKILKWVVTKSIN